MMMSCSHVMFTLAGDHSVDNEEYKTELFSAFYSATTMVLFEGMFMMGLVIWPRSVATRRRII